MRAILFTLLLAVVATGMSADVYRVEVTPAGFFPLSVSIEPRDTVWWVNVDASPHRPTAVDLSWQTPTLASRDSAYVVFDTLGAFPYTCAFRPLMAGEVIVEYALSTPQTSVRQPALFVLEANYPNPFNPGTSIPYVLKGDRTMHVVLGVYNVLGQEIRRLVDDHQGPGRYEAYWDGTDYRGVAVPSGVYFSRMQVGDETYAQRMVLTR